MVAKNQCVASCLCVLLAPQIRNLYCQSSTEDSWHWHMITNKYTMWEYVFNLSTLFFPHIVIVLVFHTSIAYLFILEDLILVRRPLSHSASFIWGHSEGQSPPLTTLTNKLEPPPLPNSPPHPHLSTTPLPRIPCDRSDDWGVPLDTPTPHYRDQHHPPQPAAGWGAGVCHMMRSTLLFGCCTCLLLKECWEPAFQVHFLYKVCHLLAPFSDSL